MGRPRKNPEGVEIEETEAAEETKEEAPLPELKRCPSCGGEAEVYKDHNGLYRCACKSCHFWDCVPNYTPETAAHLWNNAGGPNPAE